MEKALLIGSSGGIGKAVAEKLRHQGVSVHPLSRRESGLDVTDEAQIAAMLSPLTGHFDLIFIATGALSITRPGPEKTLRAFSQLEFDAQMRLNAMAPLIILKHAIRLMPKDRRCVFAALSARVGSIGDNHLGGWYSYRAAKAALNALLHGAAIELKRTHKQAIIALLHPGTVATSFTKGYPEHPKTTPDQAAGALLSVIKTLTPEKSGQFFDAQGITIPW